MNNQLFIATLQEELDELTLNHSFTVTPQLVKNKIELSESLELLSSVQGHSFSLFDCEQVKFYCHHSIYESSLHYGAVYTQQTINAASLTELSHPDRHLFLLQIKIVAFKFLQSLPVSHISKFCFIYQQRLKNKKGQYDCYILDIKVLLCDATGKAWLLLIKTNLCTIPQATSEDRYKIFSLQPANLFRKSEILNKHDYIFLTNRQKEVIELIKNGLSKKEIAQKLFLTEATIKTHCEHIKSKLCFKSISLASDFAYLIGLMRVCVLYIVFNLDDFILLSY